MSDAALFSGLGGTLFFIAILVALYRVKCIRVDIWQIRKDVSDIRDILAKESKYFPADRDFYKPDNKPAVNESTTDKPSATKTSVNHHPAEGKGWKL